MTIFKSQLPLSLYIHIPWCVRKCPYCDFNSHAAKETLPEEIYVNALIQELSQQAELVKNRPIISIFFGGGTPSLFSGKAIQRILDNVAKYLSLAFAVEITLEANPGTIDQIRFKDFRAAGINRLSLGIQSLQNDKLKKLGRIHDEDNAKQAIQFAKAAGFANFNLDIMHGLPGQTVADALYDIETALHFEPTHFSWYQLTIEPNTLFYHQTPTLPEEDILWEIQERGLALITQKGYQQYEVSAYAQPGKTCLHNKNYWEFGDYLGIGAGAHSKITDIASGNIKRYSQTKHPKDYLDATIRQNIQPKIIASQDVIFEFMLNALRLTDGVPISLFEERTGLSSTVILPLIKKAKERGLLLEKTTHISPSPLGKKFLNDLMMIFLPKNNGEAGSVVT